MQTLKNNFTFFGGKKKNRKAKYICNQESEFKSEFSQ